MRGFQLVLGITLVMVLLRLPGCESKQSGLIYQSQLTIWLLDPGSGVKRKLFEPAQYAVAFSNNLDYIAYSRDSYDLWISNIDGTQAKSVIDDIFRQSRSGIVRLSWSPDDERIAVLTAPDEFPRRNPEKITLYTVEVSTNEVRKIAEGVLDFAWMRDGHSLIVNRQFQVPQAIYQASVDGLSFQPIFAGEAGRIALSPGAGKIAFTTTPQVGVSYLHVLTLATGEVIDLSQFSPFVIQYIKSFSWSPDDRYLACSAVILEDGELRSALLVVDTFTMNWRELSRSVGEPLVWSPTGEAIATVIIDASGIYQISVKTGEIRKLTEDCLATPTNFEWR